MNANNMKDLQLKQLSDSLQKGMPVPIELIGSRIKVIREALGMTQKQLALRAGVKQPVISRMEENCVNCSLKTISRIAKALNFDSRVFFSTTMPLEEIVRKRYAMKAGKLLERVDSNMAMEKQAPKYSVEQEKRLSRITEEMRKKKHSGLWDA